MDHDMLTDPDFSVLVSSTEKLGPVKASRYATYASGEKVKLVNY